MSAEGADRSGVDTEGLPAPVRPLRSDCRWAPDEDGLAIDETVRTMRVVDLPFSSYSGSRGRRDDRRGRVRSGQEFDRMKGGGRIARTRLKLESDQAAATDDAQKMVLPTFRP